jgi:hypothetical protein
MLTIAQVSLRRLRLEAANARGKPIRAEIGHPRSLADAACHGTGDRLRRKAGEAWLGRVQGPFLGTRGRLL